MQKLAINEAAEILGITKEAVYNRIRRGSINTVIENGTKFVILDEKPSSEKATKSAPKSTKTKSQNDEFVNYLLNELSELKSLNLNLQADKDRLFKEKEQMLIERKNEILQIYKDRDEKLMQFLNAMQRPLLAQKNDDIPNNEAIEAEIENESKWINLSEYLKELNLKPKATKKVSEKIIKNIHHSKFIKFKRGVILVRKHKNLKELIGEI
ncbi:DNA-binding protein [Campylobacter concisus]|uniref:DNA-binding protein n=1 Tax=Campylobacter concisus TaxID=199 RepID=UPI0018A9AAF7|nr:DNA-binding protein [Campylobacter concisus]QPH98779.1 DNA-binding protein [Campylobacter concisus]QPI00573.1 DNA-binding protein [Campylobacter concisus]